MITADQIKPKVRGQADFFRWNLYRFILHNPRHTSVYRTPDHGMIIGLDYGDVWFSGKRLTSVTVGDLHTTAYIIRPGWKDITAKFWPNYLAHGVCVIHGDLVHKWQEDGGVRTCEYCGKVQHQRTRTVKQVEWFDVPTKGNDQ